MGEEEEEEEKRAILHTPTWALATICLILIAVSILIEYSIHLLAKVFTYIQTFIYVYQHMFSTKFVCILSELVLDQEEEEVSL